MTRRHGSTDANEDTTRAQGGRSRFGPPANLGRQVETQDPKHSWRWLKAQNTWDMLSFSRMISLTALLGFDLHTSPDPPAFCLNSPVQGFIWTLWPGG